jgi:uncharacterized protein YajQ (UPF0234 family)
LPTFDAVCEVDKVELRNAVDQTNKEIANRFDFKGSDSKVELTEELNINVYADDKFKLEQVYDVLASKLSKRGVDLRSLSRGLIQSIGGDKVKQEEKVIAGIDKDLGKKIIKLLKDSKLKVQGSIQGDIVRVSGSKRDTLQDAIALLKKEVQDTPIQFKNFRE